jgi:hypothetical protein
MKHEHDECLLTIITQWMPCMSNIALSNRKNTMNTRHEQQCDDHQATISHIQHQTLIKTWRRREERRNIPKLQWQLWQWTTYHFVSHTREATPPNTKFEHHFLTPNPKLKPHFSKSYTLINFKLLTSRSLEIKAMVIHITYLENMRICNSRYGQ